ncbi:hypothetical protein [Desulfatitalea alkaliphila]|uniref:Glucose-6-phosphate dehydrogenase C-terminal domain-containing protein n=1 Tax=Desulfatitalea alkaliphila TaxID=2929485 RepID=A0AA41UHW3_9BACT|nr:hypothetical protein [Desulfatitalea alkaliphila]MCJ8499032.1 hypothetical protein [Desulfatitalea alkaliphila]
MKTDRDTIHPAEFVIFGGSSDLTRRKLVPALFDLFADGWMPNDFRVLGISRSAMDDAQFRDHVCRGIGGNGRNGPEDKKAREAFFRPSALFCLRFEVKKPGVKLQLAPVMMQFYYREAFKVNSPGAYETLLLDILKGDTTLFLRDDQTEAAWSVMSPVLEFWNEMPPTDFPNYQAGSWGPAAADMLIAREGRT